MVKVVGDVFGSWTVIRDLGLQPVGTGRKQVVLCRCECGNKRKVQVNNLRSGGTRGCGCRRIERIAGRHRNYKPAGMAAARNTYGNYRRGAVTRQLSFEITFEQFLTLTQLNCHYCDQAPSAIAALYHNKGPHKGSLRVNGTYTYNGIDRQDPTKGYTLQNCVSACFRCNYAKNDLSVAEFTSWISRAAAHLQKTTT